jgi:predicted flap endonuclease-1-like 5' DNA nuclease
MLALGLQTFLLMSAAYCLGAALACCVRRLFFSPARVPLRVERRVEPLPQTDADLVGIRRFVRADREQDSPPTQPPAAAAAQAAALPLDSVADQDLERIHGIDAATAAALRELGIRRYADIGRWLRADLERIAQVLAIRRSRINRENWIEQAQILASGGETHHARRRARGETASASPTADQGERRTLVPQPPPPATPARRAKTVAPASTTPGAIATAPPARRDAVRARPPTVAAPALSGVADPPRVSERAAFARPVPAGSPAAAAGVRPPAPRQTLPLAADAPAAASGPAAAQAPAAPSPLELAKPVRPPAPAAADNLLRIRGINAQAAAELTAAGIGRYQQIATWSATDVDRFARQLGTGGRIARENWIEQAQILSKGGDTAFSRAFDRQARADPSRPPADAGRPEVARRPPAGKAADEPPPTRPVLLGALRSVRSQAYQNPEPGPEAAHRVGSRNRVVRTLPPQDLKRIRGIGVLIEKRLNAMQIATYEQIANWTADDIERVSRTLDFKGRIERENWVEQARILASGGATEFSRRLDRGDVEPGRYRP